MKDGSLMNRPVFRASPPPPDSPLWVQLMPAAGTGLVAGLLSYFASLPVWLFGLILLATYTLIWHFSIYFLPRR